MRCAFAISVSATRHFMAAMAVLSIAFVCLFFATSPLGSDAASTMPAMASMGVVPGLDSDAVSRDTPQVELVSDRGQLDGGATSGTMDCEVCFDHVHTVCAAVDLALLTLSMLGLLLGTVRDTFLRLEPREPVTVVRRALARRWATGESWPYALCVMRT